MRFIALMARGSLFLFLTIGVWHCGRMGVANRVKADSRTKQSSLRELAETHGLGIGSVYQDDPDPRYKAVFTREYDVVTIYAGWEMLHRESRASYDFTSTDQAVEFGERNGFGIQGQSLVWYYLIPPWVEGLPSSEIEAVMNEHIDRVVGRYRGRVKAWNVVNEAVDDDGRALRRGFAWSNAMGDDYIAKAFFRAHRADPDAVLYYNESGMERSDEIFQTVKRLLRDLLDRGVPVHALGWQMHLEPTFDSRTLLGRMTEIAAMGLDNYITELDVKLPENPTPEDYERQRQIYRDVVRIFLQAPRRRTLVVWGLRDGLDTDWLTKNHPLPFDEQYRRKPAYFGIQEALSRLTTTPPPEYRKTDPPTDGSGLFPDSPGYQKTIYRRMVRSKKKSWVEQSARYEWTGNALRIINVTLIRDRRFKDSLQRPTRKIRMANRVAWVWDNDSNVQRLVVFLDRGVSIDLKAEGAGPWSGDLLRLLELLDLPRIQAALTR